MSYNILSLDGGGVFGMHTAVILDRLSAACPDFIDKVDLIAGTSIGGIISLGLANGFTPSKIVDSFSTDVGTIFSSSILRKVGYATGVRAKYDNSGVNSVLTNYFGDKKLSDLSKKVIIQSFQINGSATWDQKVFHNLDLKNGINPDKDVTAVYVGMATSAAPIYFPSLDNFIDGGVAQNNPAMTAVAMTQDKCYNIPQNPKLEDINLLSIGRVYPNNEISGSNLDWGYVKWVFPLVDILLTGNVTSVDYQCRQFLGEKYFRIASEIPGSSISSIDNVSDVPAIKSFSENVDITDLINWTKNNW